MKLRMFICSCMIIVCSCKKTTIDNYQDIETSNNCENFPNLFMSYFSNEGCQYQAPCFNPNNSNEIIYIYQELGKRQLMKYNLKTFQKTIIVEQRIGGQPKWNKQGRIAFTTIGLSGYVEHIFTIKDNGDSLTQTTINTANYDPVLGNDNSLYWQHSPTLGHPYFFLRKKGIDTDTILYDSGQNYGFCRNGDISINNQLIAHTLINNKNHIGIASINNDELNFVGIIDLEKDFDYDRTDGLCWNNLGSVFYFSITGGDKRGLYKGNLNGSYQLLLSYCDKKRYTILSHSPNANLLISERVDSRLELDSTNSPTGKIITNSSIWLINLETLEEIKINFE